VCFPRWHQTGLKREGICCARFAFLRLGRMRRQLLGREQSRLRDRVALVAHEQVSVDTGRDLRIGVPEHLLHDLQGTPNMRNKLAVVCLRE